MENCIFVRLLSILSSSASYIYPSAGHFMRHHHPTPVEPTRTIASGGSPNYHPRVIINSISRYIHSYFMEVSFRVHSPSRPLPRAVLQVEINNTDAEGRLVLSDGVAYAARHLNPSVIVDVATLTGAQGVTTGRRHASVLSNDEGLEQMAVDCGRSSGDLVHPVVRYK